MDSSTQCTGILSAVYFSNTLFFFQENIHELAEALVHIQKVVVWFH